MEFRAMELSDVQAVAQVEKKSFYAPWDASVFKKELTENELARYIVGVENGKAVAYGGFWLVFGEAQVTNIAVLPEYRGSGNGQALTRAMADYAKALGAETMILEVRVSNARAIHVYEKLGYRTIAVRKEYYSDNLEDAYVMQLDLKGGESHA